MDPAQKFREAAARHNRRRARMGWRYPDELRAIAVAYCDEKRREGRSWDELSQDLGVSPLTLNRWREAARSRRSEEGGFRQVLVATATTQADGPVSLITPDGFRIEGLDADAVPELLRRLR